MFAVKTTCKDNFPQLQPEWCARANGRVLFSFSTVSLFFNPAAQDACVCVCVFAGAAPRGCTHSSKRGRAVTSSGHNRRYAQAKSVLPQQRCALGHESNGDHSEPHTIDGKHWPRERKRERESNKSPPCVRRMLIKHPMTAADDVD